MYYQGARVKSSQADKRPAKLLPESQYDRIVFEVRQEARRLADANRNKSWAQRWLRGRA